MEDVSANHYGPHHPSTSLSEAESDGMVNLGRPDVAARDDTHGPELADSERHHGSVSSGSAVPQPASAEEYWT